MIAPSMPAAVAELEERMIRQALAASRGNVREATKALQASERTVWHKIKRYRIDPRDYRQPPDPA